MRNLIHLHPIRKERTLRVFSTVIIFYICFEMFFFLVSGDNFSCSPLPIVLCDAFLCLHRRQERRRWCASSYLSPSGGQSVPGNMPSSSVSGCCFASAVAYLLWKCWSGALTACGWAWACWRQRWSQCASPADLCWGWREQRKSSRWMHTHRWPPGEGERD